MYGLHVTVPSTPHKITVIPGTPKVLTFDFGPTDTNFGICHIFTPLYSGYYSFCLD